MEARLDIPKLVTTGVEGASMETFDFPVGAGPFPGRSAAIGSAGAARVSERGDITRLGLSALG